MSQIRKTPGQDLAGRIAMAGVAVALVGFLAGFIVEHHFQLFEWYLIQVLVIHRHPQALQ
jgi:undecaprenyl pyrophosphate phosphatase UppP